MYDSEMRKEICEAVDDSFQGIYDVLKAMKERGAVKPKKIDGKHNHFIKCGNCNYDLLTGYMFCPHCGTAVKWE